MSKLKGPAKWTYFYLYVILDVFSRYIVGWTVQYRETAQLAKALIEQATEQQQITPKILTLHADRGGPMRAKPVAFLLADLGVTKTHSRPYTSSDNPYSESNFKTLKYRPEFPERFDDIEHARAHCRAFFHWYNHAHRHSGIGLMTPAAIHHGHAEQLHAARADVLDAAYARHPERFVRKPPAPPELPTAAWINKPRRRCRRSLNFEREASHRADRLRARRSWITCSMAAHRARSDRCSSWRVAPVRPISHTAVSKLATKYLLKAGMQCPPPRLSHPAPQLCATTRRRRLPAEDDRRLRGAPLPEDDRDLHQGGRRVLARDRPW